jgi:tagaturonate reductase
MAKKALNKWTAPKSVAPEKIIQFGEGNFLRAFVDWIVWNMNAKTNFNGSVAVVQPIEKGMVEWLNGQDCLYHVNLQGRLDGKAVNSLERIDVISRALNPYTQNWAFMALAEQPEIRFVISNTTEAGITFDDSCKFTDAPASSYPGKLVQLLFRRYKTFNGDPTKGLIFMPCELIFLNGHHLKDCIRKYIELWKDDFGADYEGFKEWFEKYNYVCATLVDRIVPGFPRKDIAEIQEKVGYNDNLVVQAEIFHLWVIEKPENMSIEELEAEFPANKAGLNVLIAESEKPYHERKVTLLNGPHTVLSPVTYLSGVNIVRDACNHEVLGKYIHKVMFDELLETLNLPKEELKAYGESVLERFNNPYVDHQVTSIMLNSFPKFETRDLPGLKVYLERKGELPKGLVLGLAAIIEYYKGGVREDGAPIQPNDAQEIMDLLKELWATGDTRKVAEGVLGATDVIWKESKENLNKIPGLTDLVELYLNSIESVGMLKTVQLMLAADKVDDVIAKIKSLF